MKKIKSIAVLTLILATIFTFAVPKAFAGTPTMAIRPSKSTGLALDEIFTVDITFRDFSDMYSWQVGIQWDPTVLEATGNVLYGKVSWPESVFAVLAPTRSTNPMPGTIDNVAGKIYPPYAEALTGTGGVTGTAGTEYKLMRVEFRVRGFAPSGTNISFIVSDPYGPVSCWAQYPAVSTLLTPLFEIATVYTTAPPTPSGPTAAFSYSPSYIETGMTVTFDASASKGGFNGTVLVPITEYRWDFDSDLIFDLNTTEKIVTHVYDTAGDYNVTLEVYAPGVYPPGVPDTNRTTKTITVFAPAAGARLELTSNKEPYNGFGPGQPSDAFAPQELVILYAKVTYNGEPVANKLVGFQVNDPNGTPVIFRTNVTDDTGLTWVEFRLPSDPPFGEWLAIAKVEVAQVIVGDTMPFKVGWIVEIVSVEPGASSYAKNAMATFNVRVNNIAFTTKNVTLTITVYDACGVPIYATSFPGWTIEGEAVNKEFQFIDILIPQWAFISPPAAWVYVNAYTALPLDGGVPYCPEASAWFTITP
jgi:PKD repeat protein